MRQRPCNSGVESGRTRGEAPPWPVHQAAPPGTPVAGLGLRRRGGEARALRRTLRPLWPRSNTPLPMPKPDTPLNPQVNSRLGSLKHETVGSHAALLARVEKLEEELLRAKAKS